MDLWHDLLLADLSGRGGDIVKTEARRYETLLNGRSYSQAWPRFGSTLWLISLVCKETTQSASIGLERCPHACREMERERRTDGEKERRRERYVPLSGT